MEVKKALKWFEWADDVYYCSMPNAKPDNDFYKQSRAISNLLKSLEAENKALKKENEAYKGMWGELYGLVKKWKLYPREMMMDMIRKKYLGGGE